MKAILEKIDNILIKCEEFLLIFGILAMTILLLGNVIARKVFLNSWSFAEEIGQFFIIIVTFAGIGYAVRSGQHINMTAILDMLPHKFKKIFSLIIGIVSFLILLIFTILSFRYAVYVFQTGRVTPALGIPRWTYASILPIGFGLGTIQYLINAIKNILDKEHIYLNNLGYEEEELSKEEI